MLQEGCPKIAVSSEQVWITEGQVRQDTLPCVWDAAQRHLLLLFMEPQHWSSRNPQSTTPSCAGTQLTHTQGVSTTFRYTRNLLKLGACLTVRLRSLKKNQLPLQGTGPKHTEHSIPCSPRWRARGTTASPTSFPKPRGTRKSSSFLASSC